MNDDDMKTMLARIDERTLNMVDTMKTLASRESVESVEKDLKAHIDTHISRGGLLATWAGVAVAAGLGVVGIFKGHP